MSFRKFGHEDGKIIREDEDKQGVKKTASTTSWTAEDAEALRRENSLDPSGE